MVVRPASRSDFRRVTELLEDLGRVTVTDEAVTAARALYERQLADPDTEHLVAEDAGAIVGFCSLHYRGRLNRVTQQAWIPDLIVDRMARRRGVARGLLDEAQRRAQARGCHDLTLESGDQRTEAHQLYAAFGMESKGRYFHKGLL